MSEGVKKISSETINKYELITTLKLHTDDIEKWCKFYNNIINVYNNKDITLILFSDDISGDNVKNVDKNIFVIRSYNWKIVNKILECELINI